jgi:hypothetical protein
VFLRRNTWLADYLKYDAQDLIFRSMVKRTMTGKVGKLVLCAVRNEA